MSKKDEGKSKDKKDWNDLANKGFSKEDFDKLEQQSEQEITYDNIFGISDGKPVKVEDTETKKLQQENEDKILEEMNAEHIFIDSFGGKSAVVCKVYNEVTERESLDFRPLDTFRNQYSNQFVHAENVKKGQDETLTKGDFWIKHPRRNTRKGVIFDPTKPKDWNGYLNLWVGFAITPKKGSWKLTKKHIWKILSNKSAVKYKYLYKWLAWCVQNPHDRAEVAVILTGKKGAGKSFLFNQFVKIFGDHGMTITDRSRLSGKFSAHFKLLCFLFGDEVYYPGDKDIEGRIKAIITEPFIDTEAKFRDVTTTKNRLHIAMCTNNEWVIPTGADERRYYINKVSDMYTRSKASQLEIKKYFIKLWGEMENGGREAMLYELLNYNLKGWHPRYDVPSTEEMVKQRKLSLSLLHRTVRTMLEDGEFPGEMQRYESGNQYRISAQAFFGYLHEKEPTPEKISNVKKTDLIKELGAYRGRQGGTGRAVWMFPELEEMRAIWEEHHGKHDWDNAKTWAMVKGEY